MAKKNWRKLADKEFTAMDNTWQHEWQDLRERVSKRS